MSSAETRFIDLCVDGVRSLRPYEPGKPISELEREYGVSDIVKLASNENPLGPSLKALEAIRAALPELALYPDGNGFALKRALADKHGVEMAQITLGSGSDHILELIARAFLGEKRSVVMSRYGFAIYGIVSQAAGAELRVAEPHAPDHPMAYGHDLKAMAALCDETTRVVFIANPNNPTGTWIAREELETFLHRVRTDTLVVMDEAYHEYVSEPDYPDTVALMRKHRNLVVMRTFSKAFGLAGARVGYALADPEVTDIVNRVRLSFNPNSLAQAAAVAALGDEEHIQRTVELNREGLAQLQTGFEKLGLTFIPSVCNFVTVDVGRAGREVFQALLREGVIVRPLDGYGLPTHLRVSVGLPDQNARLLAALARVLAG